MGQHHSLALACGITALVVVGAIRGGNAAVIDSINAAYEPHLAASWNVPDVGWLYTPSLSYTLTGIGTKFGSADGRSVTVEIFSGVPGSFELNTPGTLSLLGLGTVAPIAGTMVVATFPEVAITAGETYFVGFRNVQGLLVNFTFYQDPPAIQLGGVYYDSLPSNANLFNEGPEGGCCSAIGQPILEFHGYSVPEPGTGWLLLATFGVLGVLTLTRTTARPGAVARMS